MSLPGTISPTGKITQKVEIPQVAKSRGPNSNVLAHAKRILSTYGGSTPVNAYNFFVSEPKFTIFLLNPTGIAVNQVSSFRYLDGFLR